MILIVDRWQWSLLSCALTYIAAFLIMIQFWTFSFSLVKLVSGLMSLVVLGLSINKRLRVTVVRSKAEQVFRLVAFTLILLIMVFLTGKVLESLSIPLEIVLASFVMIGFGVFQLGISQEPFRVIVAILILFLGFELIFSTNETSLLVNGLLSLITLLIAFIGGYVIVNEFESSEE